MTYVDCTAEEAGRLARAMLPITAGRVLILATTGPQLGVFIWGAYNSVSEAEARLGAARESCGARVRIIDTDPPTAWDRVAS